MVSVAPARREERVAAPRASCDVLGVNRKIALGLGVALVVIAVAFGAMSAGPSSGGASDGDSAAGSELAAGGPGAAGGPDGTLSPAERAALADAGPGASTLRPGRRPEHRPEARPLADQGDPPEQPSVLPNPARRAGDEFVSNGYELGRTRSRIQHLEERLVAFRERVAELEESGQSDLAAQQQSIVERMEGGLARLQESERVLATRAEEDGSMGDLQRGLDDTDRIHDRRRGMPTPVVGP